MTAREAADMLGRSTIYMADTYPLVHQDIYRQTPERRATEILLALKDLIVLSTWTSTGAVARAGAASTRNSSR
jgi:hypothetical protein